MVGGEMDGEAALEIFDAQGQVLASILRAHGAEGVDYRVDLRSEKFWWQGSDGVPLVQARTRVICSYALSNQSVLMGWANKSLPAQACIAPVQGMSDSYSELSERGAWQVAAQAALGAGAHFLYRAPNPQMWIFLGLWDVKTAESGAQTAPRSPRQHVLAVLQQLSGVEVAGHRRVLMRNYGASLRESASGLHAGQPWEAVVDGIGARLVALADADESEIAGGFAEMVAEAEAGLS